jgi:hypothetical protein
MGPISRLLKARREKREAEFGSAEQKIKALGDTKVWYEDYCGKSCSVPRVAFDSKGSPNAWLDLTEDSACEHRIKFWKDSWKIREETGKFIHIRLEPRDSGKSVGMQCETLKLIAENRDMTIGYGAQNKAKAKDRSKWFKGRLISRNLCRTFGDFKAKGYEWTDDHITVRRPSGPGENSSLFIFSPGVSFTGAHPALWALDDMVDSKNSRSILKSETVMRSWNDIIQTCGSETMIWIVGTWWPGVHHLYDEIAEKYEKFARFEIVPAFGEARDLRGERLFSAPGKQNYPWISKKFLARQKELLPEHEYLGAYENIKGHDKQTFRLSQFAQGEPLKLNGDIISPHNLNRNAYNLYIVTDPADNDGSTRGLSKAAMAVVAVSGTGERYVLEMHLSHMVSTTFVNTFVEMYQRWMPVISYGMEINGPGKTYPGWIRERIENLGLPPLALREIHLVGLGRKEDRVMTLYHPMDKGKLIFSPAVDHSIIHWEPGELIPKGEITKEATHFNPIGTKEPIDGLDCLAMSFLVDRDGPICPTPQLFESEEQLGTNEFYQRQMQDKIKETIRAGYGGNDAFVF